MDAEAREILKSLLAGQRVAEAERAAILRKLEEISAQQIEHGVTLGEHSARFEAIDARFEAIDARFEAIDARFEAIDARFEAIDARFEAIDARLEELSGQLRSISVDLSGVKKQVGELSARDRYFASKLGEHDMEIALLKQQLKAE